MLPLKLPTSAAFVLLTGCVGTTTPPTFAELDADAGALAATVQPDIDFGPTPVFGLITGSATFQGNAALGEDIDDEVEALGELTINMEFDENDVDLRIYNIAGENEGPIDGELTGFGEIDYSGGYVHFLLPLAGTLITDDSVGNFEGIVAGERIGGTGETISIDGIGLMTVDGVGSNTLEVLGYAISE